MIKFEVEDHHGETKVLEFPTDMGLNVMEALKASDYPILATCGGMALCATCHVEVTKGFDKLAAPNDMELDMIDTLPNATDCSRLACQLNVNDDMANVKLVLKDEEL
ncbi:MAG: 2Fe-2S iron-sulfur cluster-binding protein [Bacteroidota bacterium]